MSDTLLLNTYSKLLELLLYCKIDVPTIVFDNLEDASGLYKQNIVVLDTTTTYLTLTHTLIHEVTHYLDEKVRGTTKHDEFFAFLLLLIVIHCFGVECIDYYDWEGETLRVRQLHDRMTRKL